MCNFFSFVTCPSVQPRKVYYFDWNYRKDNLYQDCDTHSGICAYFDLDEDICNKYEYNPLTNEFTVDQVNAVDDDSLFAQEWAENLDISKVIAPLVVKEIVNPLLSNHSDTIDVMWLLYQWASVWDSVGASVWNSVGASVGASVWNSVRASVWASVRASVGASVRDSVRDSVWASVWAYVSTFFTIDYEFDFSALEELWENGYVPSFDGETWRLHVGPQADIILEISQDDLFATYKTE